MLARQHAASAEIPRPIFLKDSATLRVKESREWIQPWFRGVGLVSATLHNHWPLFSINPNNRGSPKKNSDLRAIVIVLDPIPLWQPFREWFRIVTVQTFVNGFGKLSFDFTHRVTPWFDWFILRRVHNAKNMKHFHGLADNPETWTGTSPTARNCCTIPKARRTSSPALQVCIMIHHLGTRG